MTMMNSYDPAPCSPANPEENITYRGSPNTYKPLNSITTLRIRCKVCKKSIKESTMYDTHNYGFKIYPSRGLHTCVQDCVRPIWKWGSIQQRKVIYLLESTQGSFIGRFENAMFFNGQHIIPSQQSVLDYLH